MNNADFYEKILYPLQDKVLALVDKHGKDFFLTGGTALNRFYDGWRYSDDLDFFSLAEISDFRKKIKDLSEIFVNAKFGYKIDTMSESFCRVVISQGKGDLKVDFVNDPVFRYGEVGKFRQFSRVDNRINILSNKLTAISRYEVKDIVDICLIAQHGGFFWQDVVATASKKSPVDPLDIAQIMRKMPKNELKIIQWSKKVDLGKIYKMVRDVAKQIALVNNC